MTENKLKIAVCAIMLDENQYIEEWVNHYKKLNFDHIFIYDNNSEIPLESNDKIVSIIPWTSKEFRSQSKAYLNCCKEVGKEYDLILFVDADEFLITSTMDIHKDVLGLRKKYNRFDGLGIYWRIYGKPKPYLENRQNMEDYIYYFEDKHIKSLVNPKFVMDFPDPHKAQLVPESRYIDEVNKNITSPIGNHTSKNMYIKHIFTRSKSEYADKMKRGDANLRKNFRTWEDFYNYNDLCIKKD